MKKLLLCSSALIACGMMAQAATLSFNCTNFPTSFTTGGNGSGTISCPAFSGAPAGSVLSSVTLTYYTDYQFGGVPGSNTVNMTYTPSTIGGAVSWSAASSTATITGPFNSPSNVPITVTAASGVSAANFASSFNVGVVSNVSAGTVGTSSAGVQVAYAYTSAVPEPATFSLIGLSLVGAGFYSRRRRSL